MDTRVFHACATRDDNGHGAAMRVRVKGFEKKDMARQRAMGQEE